MSTGGGIKGAWGIPLIHRKLCPLPFPPFKKNKKQKNKQKKKKKNNTKKMPFPQIFRFLPLHQNFAHAVKYNT